MSSGAKGSFVLLGRFAAAAAAASSRNTRACDAGNVSSSAFSLSGRRTHATSSWSKVRAFLLSSVCRACAEKKLAEATG